MVPIKQIKQYWNRRPCNIRHSSAPLGSNEYFDEVEKRRYFAEPHIPGFAQFDKWKGKKVLEIGCGIGTDSIRFARAGATLTLVELSDKSLEMCKKRFDTYGFKAQFYCGNAEELSTFVPVEAYDLIYSFGVIHHTPHPEKVFAEIKKYCKPGTEIRVMLYSRWSWKVFWILMKYGKGTFWRINELVRMYSEAQTGCPVTWCYSFKDVRRLMSGFEIVEIRKDHIFPYHIPKYVNHQYEKVWYFRIMPQPLFDWMKRCFGWHTLVVAKIRQ